MFTAQFTIGVIFLNDMEKLEFLGLGHASYADEIPIAALLDYDIFLAVDLFDTMYDYNLSLDQAVSFLGCGEKRTAFRALKAYRVKYPAQYSLAAEKLGFDPLNK